MTKWRSPVEQHRYAENVWYRIKGDANEKRKARLNSGDYKEFREEFFPFSKICVEYYDFPETSNCRLSPDRSENHDGQVEGVSGEIHQFEITRVIKGDMEKEEMKALSRNGNVIQWTGKYGDTQEQRRVAEHALVIANDKSRKDYRSSTGSSTLVIQVSCEKFDESNSHHKAVYDYMVTELMTLKYLVDEVILMKPNFYEGGNTYSYVKIK